MGLSRDSSAVAGASHNWTRRSRSWRSSQASREGEAELKSRLERERHQRTTVGRVEEVGGRRVLIHDIKRSDSDKRGAIPETDAPYLKGSVPSTTLLKLYVKFYLLILKVIQGIFTYID